MSDGIIDLRRSALLLIDLQQRLLPKIGNAEEVIAAAEWLEQAGAEAFRNLLPRLRNGWGSDDG